MPVVGREGFDDRRGAGAVLERVGVAGQGEAVDDGRRGAVLQGRLDGRPQVLPELALDERRLGKYRVRLMFGERECSFGFQTISCSSVPVCVAEVSTERGEYSHDFTPRCLSHKASYDR